jgi:hypothetical protein
MGICMGSLIPPLAISTSIEIAVPVHGYLTGTAAFRVYQAR